MSGFHPRANDVSSFSPAAMRLALSRYVRTVSIRLVELRAVPGGDPLVGHADTEPEPAVREDLLKGRRQDAEGRRRARVDVAIAVPSFSDRVVPRVPRATRTGRDCRSHLSRRPRSRRAQSRGRARRRRVEGNATPRSARGRRDHASSRPNVSMGANERQPFSSPTASIEMASAETTTDKYVEGAPRPRLGAIQIAMTRAAIGKEPHPRAAAAARDRRTSFPRARTARSCARARSTSRAFYSRARKGRRTSDARPRCRGSRRCS